DCGFHQTSPPLNGGWVQPPDAENRMSGGVGGLTGAIPSARPDPPGHRATGAANEFAPTFRPSAQGMETLLIFVLIPRNEN
ncbi:hypothetical protein, partial [Thiocystis minor]|uniref:hypothetical protein n=1 Tax=Thiocystis minor TaxID=61597 RepID=UPI001A92AC8A